MGHYCIFFVELFLYEQIKRNLAQACFDRHNYRKQHVKVPCSQLGIKSCWNLYTCMYVSMWLPSCNCNSYLPLSFGGLGLVYSIVIEVQWEVIKLTRAIADVG